MATNGNYTYGPAPVDAGTTSTTPVGPLDRGPAAVPPGPGTGTVVPTNNTPVVPQVELPVDPVEAGLGTGTSTTQVVPQVELPVDTAGANVVAGPNVSAPAQQRYITVLANGVVIANNVSTLNFLGNGVTVSNNGTTGANITITSSGGGGNADLGNWAFVANTQYNLNGGAINNSDLTHGATASLTLPANGNTTAISLLNYYGNIAVIAATSPSATKTFTFDSDGGFTAPGSITGGNLTLEYSTIRLAAGAAETTLDISPNIEGYAYVQVPKDSVANTANLRIHNDIGNVELSAGGNYWYFGTDGNLTIPNGGYINFVNTGGITQAVNEDLRFTVSDNEEDGWAIQSTVNDGAGNDLTRMQVRYDGVRINTDLPTNNYNWDFRDTGEFDVPKSIRGPVGGNLVVSIGDQFGSTTFIDLQTRSYVGDALISNVRIANPNVTVSTSSGAYNWTFGGTGNLTLPLSGNIVGATANNNGYLNWFGNSSGDGGGYTTLRLVPDDTRESADQYLIIDPTAPGHIHIRAGGTQDNSNADLFLGGENSYFKVNAGANNEVRISANSHAWVFGADSILTVPGEGIIRSVQDTVILQSYDINGNTYSARLGTTGGLYFETTEYPLGWLNLTNNAGDANISSPGGSINIDAANGTSGAAGKEINITAGDADQGDYYTTAGGDINIQGGMGAFNDGGGGGPGGNVNLVAGTSADPAGHAGNVTITSGTWNWQFYNDGNLYVPKNINGDNNGNLVIDGAGYGNGYISLPAGSFGGEQVAIVNDFSLGNGITLTTGGGTWHFGNTGSITFPDATVQSTAYTGATYGNANVVANLAALGSNPVSTTGNITGGYILGNGSQLTGLPATYGNANVVANLAALGSNPISTTGNITGGNLSVVGSIVANNITGYGNIIFNQTLSTQGGSDMSLIPGTGLTRSYGNFRPYFANTYDLGGSTTRWNNIYANVTNSVTHTVTGNITGGNINTAGVVSATGAVTGQTLVSTLSTVNEGGEITLALPSSGSTLSTSITIDSYQDRLRFFETGGSTRGMFIDLANMGNITANAAQIGYINIPQVSFSANATAALSDSGKHYYSTTAGNLALTLPDNSNVAFATGTTLTIVVNAAGNVLVNQGTGVSLYMAGSSTTGNRAVGAYGLASVMKVAANTWVISGTGVY